MTIKAFPSHAEPVFESASQQHLVWRARWGCYSDVGRLHKVLAHRPGDEMNIIDPARRLDHLSSYGDANGETWYWRGEPPGGGAGTGVDTGWLVVAHRHAIRELRYRNRALAYDKVWLGGGGINCSAAALLRDPVS